MSSLLYVTLEAPIDPELSVDALEQALTRELSDRYPRLAMTIREQEFGRSLELFDSGISLRQLLSQKKRRDAAAKALVDACSLCQCRHGRVGLRFLSLRDGESDDIAMPLVEVVELVDILLRPPRDSRWFILPNLRKQFSFRSV